MSAGRHSYVPFYASDWIAGTARMTPMQELIYFRVCCYIWDKAEPVPDGELPLMLGNIDGWQETIDLFIQSGKLDRSPNGITNKRALGVSQESLRLWKKKSSGGKTGAAKRWEGKVKPKKTNKKEADGTPNGTPNGSGMGVPMHNQNHNQSKVPEGTLRDSRFAEESFNKLWKTWAPNKTPKGDKGDALDQWKKQVIKPGVDPGMVISRADAYCIECMANDTNTKNVFRWIRDHRWNDERLPIKQSGSNPDRTADRRREMLKGMEDAGRLDGGLRSAEGHNP